MNWKSTAAVSGATTLLATFFGWPPSSHQANPPASQGQTAPVVLSDIQSEAARLQTRVRKELDYRDPTRNLFRFGPLHADDLALTVGAGVVVLCMLELLKAASNVRLRF